MSSSSPPTPSFALAQKGLAPPPNPPLFGVDNAKKKPAGNRGSPQTFLGTAASVAGIPTNTGRNTLLGQ